MIRTGGEADVFSSLMVRGSDEVATRVAVAEIPDAFPQFLPAA